MHLTDATSAVVSTAPSKRAYPTRNGDAIAVLEPMERSVIPITVAIFVPVFFRLLSNS